MDGGRARTFLRVIGHGRYLPNRNSWLSRSMVIRLSPSVVSM
jgi:hypothetical protein